MVGQRGFLFQFLGFFLGLDEAAIANDTIIASLRGPSLLKGKWEAGLC